MTPAQQQAITGFIVAVDTLRNAGIIRSHRYLGDIGEFLCADAFGINLSTNLRQAGEHMTHNLSVNRTTCKLGLQVPSTLRAPAVGYLKR